MGCGQAKGGAVSMKVNVRLSKVGVHSVDRFVDQVGDVVKSFDDIADLLGDRKKRLDDLTGFWRVRGARLKHSVLGILFQLFAVANGDPSKVDIDILERKPYIKFRANGLTGGQVENYIEALTDYMNVLSEAVEDKLPNIVDEMVNLGGKAANVKDDAASEFDALDAFKKTTAIAKTVTIVADTPKIVNHMKKLVQELKEQIKEIQELTKTLKNDKNEFAEYGKKCAGKGDFRPIDCYELIYGKDYGKAK